MIDTMNDVANPRKAAPGSVAEQLIAQARAEGVSLVGLGSPLAALPKQLLETALEPSWTSIWATGMVTGTPRPARGSERAEWDQGQNVYTDLGPVSMEVPRDRDGSFEPIVVRKRQRRLGGKDAIPGFTDKVVEEMTEWQNRALDRGRCLAMVANPGQEKQERWLGAARTGCRCR